MGKFTGITSFTLSKLLGTCRFWFKSSPNKMLFMYAIFPHVPKKGCCLLRCHRCCCTKCTMTECVSEWGSGLLRRGCSDRVPPTHIVSHFCILGRQFLLNKFKELRIINCLYFSYEVRRSSTSQTYLTVPQSFHLCLHNINIFSV